MPSRRERIAEVTREDLSAAARALLIEGGVEAVTVRAVAARAGMTAPAIYRYFTNREALLTRVMTDLLADLASHMQAVVDQEPTAAGRWQQACRAFRHWALDHRVEFGLIFGDPPRGVNVICDVPEGPGFDRVWFGLFAAIAEECRPDPWPLPLSPAEREWVDSFNAQVGRDVDPALAMRFLYAWQELYGAVCTEAFGHLSWAIDDAGGLFEARLAQVGQYLGLVDRGRDADPDTPEPAEPAEQPGIVRPRRPV